MKALLVCLLIFMAVGGWQGYAFYTEKVSGYENTISDKDKEIGLLNQKVAADRERIGVEQSNIQDLWSRLAKETQTIHELLAVMPHPTTSPPTAPAAPTPSKIFVPPSPLPAKPNWVWTTTDGRIYKNVVVTKIEADCATILDDEGGGLVPIATLPPEIQKLCNYDPQEAQQAAAKRSEDDQYSKTALEAEKKAAADVQTQYIQVLSKQQQIVSQSQQASNLQTEIDEDEEKIKELQTELDDESSQSQHTYPDGRYWTATSGGLGDMMGDKRNQISALKKDENELKAQLTQLAQQQAAQQIPSH